MGIDDWWLDRLLTIFKGDLEVRERAVGTTGNRADQSPNVIPVTADSMPVTSKLM